MNRFVFDSSAILTLYHNEPGKQQVLKLLDRGDPFISSANLCEVLTKLAEGGLNVTEVWETFHALEIDVVNFDTDQAIIAADLRLKTKHLGLSLGDRACLALSIVKKAIAVTADRNRSLLDVCRVETIR